MFFFVGFSWIFLFLAMIENEYLVFYFPLIEWLDKFVFSHFNGIYIYLFVCLVLPCETLLNVICIHVLYYTPSCTLPPSHTSWIIGRRWDGKGGECFHWAFNTCYFMDDGLEMKVQHWRIHLITHKVWYSWNCATAQLGKTNV